MLFGRISSLFRRSHGSSNPTMELQPPKGRRPRVVEVATAQDRNVCAPPLPFSMLIYSHRLYMSPRHVTNREVPRVLKHKDNNRLDLKHYHCVHKPLELMQHPQQLWLLQAQPQHPQRRCPLILVMSSTPAPGGFMSCYSFVVHLLILMAITNELCTCYSLNHHDLFSFTLYVVFSRFIMLEDTAGYSRQYTLT